jgi:photosystem II stability/assembly factor-like uncharacterized protein
MMTIQTIRKSVLLALIGLFWLSSLNAQWLRRTTGLIDDETGENIATIINNSVELEGCLMQNATTAWVVGQRALIFRTTNGGANWTGGRSELGATITLRSIAFSPTTPTLGIVVGGGATAGNNYTLRTTDGGTSWNRTRIVAPAANSIRFIGATTAVLAGRAGTTARTTDGGSTWTENPVAAITTNLFGMSFAPDNATGMVVGDAGRVIRTTNGGQSWTIIPVGTNAGFRSVHLFDANTAWICGDSGIVLHTTNGGTSWVRQPTPNTISRLGGMTFQTRFTGYIVGGGPGTALSVLYRTTNGGVTWTDVTPTNDIRLRAELGAISIFGTTGVICGDSGVVATNAQLLNSTVELRNTPAAFALAQNYPNPFNPSTEIRYQVGTVSDVRLEIFDMLGRKVSTLVSERKAAGSYQATFNASGFASGVYFYKLSAGSFSETRKMMLVK